MWMCSGRPAEAAGSVAQPQTMGGHCGRPAYGRNLPFPSVFLPLDPSTRSLQPGRKKGSSSGGRVKLCPHLLPGQQGHGVKTRSVIQKTCLWETGDPFSFIQSASICSAPAGSHLRLYDDHKTPPALVKLTPRDRCMWTRTCQHDVIQVPKAPRGLDIGTESP